VGNTEKSTALRTCTADKKTSTDIPIEQASNRSITKAGTGTSMTKMTLIAPIGRERSFSIPARFLPRSELPGSEGLPIGGAENAVVVLMVFPLEERWSLGWVE